MLFRSDRFSLQNYSSAQRKQVLEKMVFPLEDPAVVAARKAEKIRAEKEAAEKKAAEEKAAAEKAAGEKARAEAEAARKKRRSGKIGAKFVPGQYGNSIRDSHPELSQKTTETDKQTTKKYGVLLNYDYSRTSFIRFQLRGIRSFHHCQQSTVIPRLRRVDRQ